MNSPNHVAELKAQLEMLQASGINHIFVDKDASKLYDATMAKKKAAAKAAKPKPAKQAVVGDPVIVESAAAEQLDGFPGKRAKKLSKIAREVAKCAECGLCTTRTQTVYSRGNPNSPLMFMGEAPGADEDKKGLPFVGRAGKLLDDIISKGMKYDPDDIYVCNVLKCRPPGNRNPEPAEIDACKGYLEEQIEIIDPVVIVAWGKFAAQWLLETDTPIGKLRGKMWDVRGRKVVCTYHPAYLLRNPSAKTEVWKDVQIVMDFFGRDKPLPMRE